MFKRFFTRKPSEKEKIYDSILSGMIGTYGSPSAATGKRLLPHEARLYWSIVDGKYVIVECDMSDEDAATHIEKTRKKACGIRGFGTSLWDIGNKNQDDWLKAVKEKPAQTAPKAHEYSKSDLVRDSEIVVDSVDQYKRMIAEQVQRLPLEKINGSSYVLASSIAELLEFRNA